VAFHAIEIYFPHVASFMPVGCLLMLYAKLNKMFYSAKLFNREKQKKPRFLGRASRVEPIARLSAGFSAGLTTITKLKLASKDN